MPWTITPCAGYSKRQRHFAATTRMRTCAFAAAAPTRSGGERHATRIAAVAASRATSAASSAMLFARRLGAGRRRPRQTITRIAPLTTTNTATAIGKNTASTSP